MTARKIIEARLGRQLPPTRELAPDEREAIKRLAIQIIKTRTTGEHTMPTEIRTNRHGIRYYIEPSERGWFVGLVTKNANGSDDLHSGNWYERRDHALNAIDQYAG